MSDATEGSKGPKIRVYIKTERKPEADAPPLRFIRWKLAPLLTDLPAVEPDMQEEPGSAEGAP